jgi:hypothetical protein
MELFASSSHDALTALLEGRFALTLRFRKTEKPLAGGFSSAVGAQFIYYSSSELWIPANPDLTSDFSSGEL